MKLTDGQISKLAQMIHAALAAQNLITVRSSEKSILSKIEQVISHDRNLELQIEQQAKKMMEPFAAKVQNGEIDYQKMYGMIKKQILKDKKFII